MKIIFGRKPVLEAINSGEDIEQVYILFGQKGPAVDAVRIASKKKGIKCNEIPAARFKSLIPDEQKNYGEQNSQGIIALKSDQKFYHILDIINDARKEKNPLLLLLDSIQDTHNLGALIRSAECAGVNGVIITRHDSAPVNSTVVKTSAGATEHLKICVVNNLVQAIKELKNNGFWIIGSSLENSKDYNEVDYKMPVALIIGNEEKGIRRLTAESCDFLINIPMKGKIQSLNVSVATGILLFEILRQRNGDKSI